MIVSINPATGKTIASFQEHSSTGIEHALQAAASAQKHWAAGDMAQRVALLHRVAAALRANKARHARLISEEMGKPIAEAEQEIDKSAVTCEFYAEHAPSFLADIGVPSNASASKVVFDPLGVVLAIMPWNYPFWQFIRFAAPALAAGNAAILKHANNVPGCAVALEALFREAGTPAGLVSSLLINVPQVGQVLADSRISAVTLTGSTAVGRIIAAQAGSLMKKQVLELGGSDPFIVLADADIELAAGMAVKARFSNAGQSCIAAKRFIVDRRVADHFADAFCERVGALRLGDPLLRDTQIGPLAKPELRDNLHAQVQRSVAAGAVLRLGGEPVDGPGYFYAPTVLDHVTPGMAAAMEETFGPAAAILRVDGPDAAIALANATEFGLGASLWTADIQAADRLARRIEAGAVFINGIVASDARLPFGGVKQSGYGRELGEFGIREFTNIKTVWTGPAVS